MQEELVRLRRENNEYEVVVGSQEKEIDELKRLLGEAQDKLKDMSGKLDAQSKESKASAAEMQAMRTQLGALQAKAAAAKLHARVLGSHVARMGQPKLVALSFPPASVATLPEGFQPFGSPVLVMLHKQMVVSLPETSAKSDGSQETPRHPLLKPGEEKYADQLEPLEVPKDQEKPMTECLDGVDPSDYVWVKIPMGAVIHSEHLNVDAKTLLVAGTTLVVQSEKGRQIEVPSGSTIAVPPDAGTAKVRVPISSLISHPEGLEEQIKPTSDPDAAGNVSYEVPGGTAINIVRGQGGMQLHNVRVPPKSIVVLAHETEFRPVTSTKSSRLSGFSFSRKNCFWCRMRALGKDDLDEEALVPPREHPPGQPGKGGLVGFRHEEMECNEDCGTTRIALSRTDGSKGVVEVEVSTADGTANSIVDYTPVSHQKVRWEDGDAEDKFVEVGIVDDDFTQEGDENFFLLIENLLEGDAGIGIQRCSVIIKDVERQRSVAVPGSDLDPTQLAWEQDGFRDMTIPKPWKKLLGKSKINNAKMMSTDKARKVILLMYNAKREADRVDDKAGNARASIDDYSADFFKNYWGVVGLGKKLAEFVARLRYEYRRKVDNTVCQFTNLVGLYDAQPTVAHSIVVKSLGIISHNCAATGNNPGLFWSQLGKGKMLELRADEARAFLTLMVTNKDQDGNPFLSQEVDMDELHGFLNNVLATEAEKTGTPDTISLERLVAFAVSTIMWLNKKASSRVRAAYAAVADGDCGGRLNYERFKKGIQTLISWNEPSNKELFALGLSYEDEDKRASGLVSVESLVMATYEQHDVVCFSSVS
mmetsp:Transcript_23046/g.64012  ORF Transcript_23046/g.64012 Transcript_23046/m.64012 type:complete len:817 (-) Transcript_23046:162-2612(-)